MKLYYGSKFISECAEYLKTHRVTLLGKRTALQEGDTWDWISTREP